MTQKTGVAGLVSIVIPTYRRPRAVVLAAQSALAQTWSKIEVLVVSDGPDPETRAAVQGLDSRLRYLELPENAGPAAARNTGIDASRGEWLSFLDDDDSILPTKIEAQLRLADSAAPTKMITCRTIYRREGRDDVWPARPIEPGEDVADYILRRPSLLGRPGVVPVQSLLIHRSILEQVRFSTHKDHEDWAWLLEVWHGLGARIVFVWEPLAVYNIATASMSRSRRANWADSLAWARTYRKWMGDRAFCSFLATKAALKAKRAGDSHGFREIAAEVMRSRPGALDLAFLAGIAVLPGHLLQTLWRRSLSSGEGGAPERETAAIPPS